MHKGAQYLKQQSSVPLQQVTLAREVLLGRAKHAQPLSIANLLTCPLVFHFSSAGLCIAKIILHVLSIRQQTVYILMQNATLHISKLLLYNQLPRMPSLSVTKACNKCVVQLSPLLTRYCLLGYSCYRRRIKYIKTNKKITCACCVLASLTYTYNAIAQKKGPKRKKDLL